MTSSLPIPARHDPLEAFSDRFRHLTMITGGAVLLESMPFNAQVDLRADPADRPLLGRLGAALGIGLPDRPNTVGSSTCPSPASRWARDSGATGRSRTVVVTAPVSRSAT